MSDKPRPDVLSDEWTTPAKITRKVKLRQTRLKKDIKSGKLRAFNFGTDARPNYRIRVSDFEEYLAKLAVVPEAKPIRCERRRVPKYV